MLTPELIQKFNQATGNNVSTTGKPAVTSRADQIRSIGKTPVTPPVAVQAPQQIKSLQGSSGAISGSTPSLPTATTPDTATILGNTAKSLVSGTIESGKDIAAAIGGNTMMDKFTKLDPHNQEVMSQLIQKRNEAAKSGDRIKADKWNRLIQGYEISPGVSASELFPELNKSTEQILGDFASLGLETLSGGTLANAGAEKLAQAGEKGGLSLTQRLIEGAKTGGKYGTAFGITGAMQDNESLGGIAKSAAVGAGTGAVLGAGVEGAFGKRVTSGTANKEAKTADETIGRIIQGDAKDIPKAREALSSIDTAGVKTYKDLFTKLNDKVAELSGAQDTHLIATKKEVVPMEKLVVTTKVGDQQITHNYVEDALDQLSKFYEKTNDTVGRTEIAQLTQKANEEGLTVKEINDLAKLHGQELNGFNANGELASGLTKQAAENTRSGLKGTVRQLSGDEGGKMSQAIDQSITNTIRTRDLVGELQDKVQELKQKIKPRTLGEQAGRLFGEITNIIGLNSPKGFIEYFLGRGTGLKTLNALDLEKGLQGALKELDGLINAGNEPAFIKKAQDFLKKVGQTASAER